MGRMDLKTEEILVYSIADSVLHDNSYSKFRIGRTSDPCAGKSSYGCDYIKLIYCNDDLEHTKALEEYLLDKFEYHEGFEKQALDPRGRNPENDDMIYMYIALWH